MNKEPLSNRFDTDNEIYQKLHPLLQEHNVIIAGGAARQAYFNTDFGSTDIDLYFSYDYQLRAFRQDMKKKYCLKSKWSNYAQTLEIKELPPLQLINGISVESIFDTYDMYCCQFAIYKDTLYYTNNAVEDATNKVIRYTGVAQGDPLSLKTYFHPKGCRLIKYVFHKGYTIGDDICQKAFDDHIISFLKANTSKNDMKAFMKGEPWNPPYSSDIVWEVPGVAAMPRLQPFWGVDHNAQQAWNLAQQAQAQQLPNNLNMERVQQLANLIQVLPNNAIDFINVPRALEDIAQDEGDF